MWFVKVLFQNISSLLGSNSRKLIIPVVTSIEWTFSFFVVAFSFVGFGGLFISILHVLPMKERDQYSFLESDIAIVDVPLAVFCWFRLRCRLSACHLNQEDLNWLKQCPIP